MFNSKILYNMLTNVRTLHQQFTIAGIRVFYANKMFISCTNNAVVHKLEIYSTTRRKITVTWTNECFILRKNEYFGQENVGNTLNNTEGYDFLARIIK